MRSLLLLFTLLAGSSYTVPAHAGRMEIGMQDDNAVVYQYSNRELALQQFVDMGGTTVRINVVHPYGTKNLNDTSASAVNAGLDAYDNALAALHAHNLRPQLTLVWSEQQDPAKFARWAQNLARHFGSSVPRYSIGNEPNLEISIGRSCNAAGQRALVSRFPTQFVPSGRSYKARTLTRQKYLNLSTACARYARGVVYGKIVKAVSRALHSVNPKLQILAGETSSQPGLDWFVRGVTAKNLKEIAGWAHHPFQNRDLTPAKEPYDTWGMGNLDKVKQVVKLPLYLTEFGYPHPNSSMDKYAYGRRLKPQEVAKADVAAWKVAKKSGARLMLQYQWFLKPPFRTEYWETALLNHDDGSLTPAYLALQKLILGWYPQPAATPTPTATAVATETATPTPTPTP